MSVLAAAHTVAPSYGSWHGPEALFACLGVIAVGSALLVVTARNVVHAALWLVVRFGALAGCYLVLTAELVAWVQVLIYVGAVVVLMLFATMLTRAPIGPAHDLDSGNRRAGRDRRAGDRGDVGRPGHRRVQVGYIDVRTAPIGLGGHATAPRSSGSRCCRSRSSRVLLLAALVGAIVLTGRTIADAEARRRSGDAESLASSEPS